MHDLGCLTLVEFNLIHILLLLLLLHLLLLRLLLIFLLFLFLLLLLLYLLILFLAVSKYIAVRSSNILYVHHQYVYSLSYSFTLLPYKYVEATHYQR